MKSKFAVKIRINVEDAMWTGMIRTRTWIAIMNVLMMLTMDEEMSLKAKQSQVKECAFGAWVSSRMFFHQSK